MSHLLRFCMSNPYLLDKDGPLVVFYRAVTTPLPSVHALDLSDFTGRTVLITGATSGCGLECAQALARQGCRLILTSRTLACGEKIKSEILGDLTSEKTTIDVVELDQTSLDSIKTFAPRLRQHTAHLDVAILNAGVYQTSLRTCASTGWEETTQVNFTTTAALTLHLRPFLTAATATQPRLLLVASEVHSWIHPRHSSTTELLHNIHEYTDYERYHVSKLLLVLWSRDLAQRSEWRDVTVAAATPGFCQTQLWRNSSFWLLDGLVQRFSRSSEQGAAQYLLALRDMAHQSGAENRGGFWSDGGWRAPSTASCSVEARGLQKSLRSDVLAMLSEVGLGGDPAE